MQGCIWDAPSRHSRLMWSHGAYFDSHCVISCAKKSCMAHLEQTSAQISKLLEAFSSFWPFLPGCRPSRHEKSYFSRQFWAIHVPLLFTYRMHSRSFLLVTIGSDILVKAGASHSAFSVDFRVAEVNIKLNFPRCIANKMAASMEHKSPERWETCGQNVLLSFITLQISEYTW